MGTELDDDFWDDLLFRIADGEVIPVVGPGVVTFGGGDELLYPWLSQQLPSVLEPKLIFEKPPRDLQEVVDAQRSKEQPIDRIYRRINRIFEEDLDIRPGPTLAALASIDKFDLFLSTTFDPLLPNAVENAWPGGKPEERRAASTLRGGCPDLPQEIALLQHRFVYQILGSCAKPYRDFVIWDDDTFRFLLHLHQQLPLLPKLSEALQTKNLLVLGLSFSDWLLRFFVQIVKHQPLSELAGPDLFVSETLDPAEREKVVVYFGRLTKRLRVFPTDPIDFIKELSDRWRKKYPRVAKDPYLVKKAHREKHGAPGCIFISYANPDFEITRYVVSQLQKGGCRVWFDKEQLQLGQDWDAELHAAIERSALFISIVSDSAAGQLEGNYIIERNHGAKRRKDVKERCKYFYLPVRVDQGEPLIPDNEPCGMDVVQGERATGGHLGPELISYILEKQRENCLALGYPPPP